MTDEKGEILQGLQDVLQTEYPIAKDAIYKLEIFLRARSKRAVYELRDAFDHIAMIYSSDTSLDEAREHLAEVRTHLRRASVEPMEYLVERTWLKADRILTNGFWWWPLLLLKKPSPADIVALNRQQTELGSLLAQGRQKKAMRAALPLLNEALDGAQDVLDRLRPKELRSRLFAVALSVIVLIVGLGISAIKDSSPTLTGWATSSPLVFVFCLFIIFYYC